MVNVIHSANFEWLSELSWVLNKGNSVAPRGQVTKEALQQTATVNMRRPVVTLEERKLSTKFLGGEAYWILSGDNRVETIAPYNKNIINYSDDGQTFFGAYGPRIMSQLDYVVDKLKSDADTRQAVLTIWRENPPATKDVPCTVAVHFMIRDHKLNCHVYMRSNDLWLGFPYDVFNFSMLSHLVCCRLNAFVVENGGVIIEPGMLYHTASSRHIYEQHFEQAEKLTNRYNLSAMTMEELKSLETAETPTDMYLSEVHLMHVLDSLRKDGKSSEYKWW
jgi:thymidylate synthase